MRAPLDSSSSSSGGSGSSSRGYTDGPALSANESEAAVSRGGGSAPELITRKVLQDLAQKCRDTQTTDSPVEGGKIVKKRVDLTVPTWEALQAFIHLLGASKTLPHSQSSSDRSRRDTVGGQVPIVRACVRVRAR